MQCITEFEFLQGVYEFDCFCNDEAWHVMEIIGFGDANGLSADESLRYCMEVDQQRDHMYSRWQDNRGKTSKAHWISSLELCAPDGRQAIAD